MATERQIRANRANAAKSTGPITPEGKRASSQNAARRDFVPSTVVLKGESMRRFNDLAAALILQFQPRNSAEAGLVQIMIVARWRLLRMWGIQTAAFELEMARARQNADPATAPSGAVLAAIAFRTLADTSRSLALMHRLEAAYDRQYNSSLALLLKLREAPGPGVPVDPPPQIVTETWDDDSQNEPDFDADPGKNPTCNEQVPSERPASCNGPNFPKANFPTENRRDPLTDARGALTESVNAPAMRSGVALQRPLQRGACALRRCGPRLQQPDVSGVRMPDTHYEDTRHENDLRRTTIAKPNRPPLDRRACPRMPCSLKRWPFAGYRF
jgi:hypothetical protein